MHPTLVETLIKTRTKLLGSRHEWNLERAAKDPKKAQERILFQILKQQANTDYGRAHGFATIKTVEDFRNQVPLNDFESLREAIETQERTGRLAINSEAPVMYAMTSGTTGKPKFIPVLERTLEKFSAIQTLFLHSLLKAQPKMLSGMVLAIAGSAVEGHCEGGTPFGSTSGHFYESMPKIAKTKYVVPSAVFAVEDYDLKYLLILRLALAHRNISYIATANPSTLTRLIQLLNDKSVRLIDDLENGTFYRMNELEEEVRAAVAPLLRPDAKRAQEIRDLLAARQVVRYQDVWPTISMVSCWTGGSCGIFLQRLEGEFPLNAQIIDLGYLSSEFRATVPMFGSARGGVPTLLWYYFEFVEKEDWEKDRPAFKGLHELENDKQYYIFVTTDSGLYRYNMNDIVRVDGFHHKMPLLRFVQKGKGVTNITGEKLYECQVIQAVQQAQFRHAVPSSFYLALADEDAAVYRVYYEPTTCSLKKAHDARAEMETQIEAALRAVNVEYDTKRSSGRLKPLKLEILQPGTFEKFKSFAISRGQREGQFKIVALQYARDLAFDLGACVARKLTLTIADLPAKSRGAYAHVSTAATGVMA